MKRVDPIQIRKSW